MNGVEVTAKGAHPASLSRILVASCTLGVLLLGARAVLIDELQSAYFLTGWLTCILVVAFALSWWAPASSLALERRIKRHLCVSIVLVTAFAVHTNFRMPGGLLDWVLTLWLALALGSLVVGQFLLTRKWLICHVALSYGLAAACLFHGVHVHAHGLFAHWLLDK